MLTYWHVTGACDPHMGEIVTIESLNYPVSSSDWTVDQKNSVNLFPSRSVCLIRIFYMESPIVVQTFPTIGVKDFVPKQISGGGFFKMPGMIDSRAMHSFISLPKQYSRTFHASWSERQSGSLRTQSLGLRMVSRCFHSFRKGMNRDHCSAMYGS